MKNHRTMKHYLRVLLALVALIAVANLKSTVPSTANAGERSVDEIRDGNLRIALANKVGKEWDSIRTEDLHSIKTLDLRGNGIKNITGLEQCRDLSALWLGNYQGSDPQDSSRNEIGDLSPLSSLENLVFLNVDGNTSSFQMDVLGQCKSLKSLSLNRNNVESLEFLDSLSGLQCLSLSNNKIKSTKGISAVADIEILDLSFNKIDDWEDLIDFVSRRNHESNLYLDINGNAAMVSGKLESPPKWVMKELAQENVILRSYTSELIWPRCSGE